MTNYEKYIELDDKLKVSATPWDNDIEYEALDALHKLLTDEELDQLYERDVKEIQTKEAKRKGDGNFFPAGALIEVLKKVPADAEIWGYEGEVSGIVMSWKEDGVEKGCVVHNNGKVSW